MKTTNNPLLFFAVFLTLFIMSCSNSEHDEPADFVFESSRALDDYIMPEEDIADLQKLGFSGSQGVVMERTDFVRNIKYIYYKMQGDIEIPKDSLKSMVKEIDVNLGQKTKQYRTTNLVSTPQNIHIIGINIHHSNLRQGLTKAVENYNNLNISISFTLEFRTVTTVWQAIAAQNAADIAAFQSSGSPGGSSGFPSGGNPYSTLNVAGTTASYGIDVCEHVFTHEIGHCIGMRHTDFFNRSISCGTGGNEGDGGVGAIHIPGTPQTTNIDMDSIFLACFDGTETGEFSDFDVIGLETIY